MKKSARKKNFKIPVIDIKKYGGASVAILNGKIIASGPNLKEVIRIVKERVPTTPLREISILSVPRTLTVIYYA